jgi:outer membrane protein OmpA-like peptidoglycan-associated protein
MLRATALLSLVSLWPNTLWAAPRFVTQPAAVPLPPGFQLVDGRDTAWDSLELAFTPIGSRVVEKHLVEGHRWWMAARLQPPPKTRLAFDECKRQVAEALTAGGWTLVASEPTLIAKRGDHTWFSLRWGGSSDWLDMTIFEETRPPRTLRFAEPGTDPEALKAGGEPPYLARIEGATLEYARIVSSTLEVTQPSDRERVWVGNPKLDLSYGGIGDMSAHECMRLYRAALENAGWTIVKQMGGGGPEGDGVLLARYTRKQRDLWLYLHAGNRWTLQLTDSAATAAASRLSEELSKKGRVAIYGIYFDVDQATLRPESEATLLEIKKLLDGDPHLSLGIEGHTDDSGSHAHNQPLSEARAAAVRKWLVDHAVAAVRLTTAGFAETKPVADNHTPEGRHLNRRVELVKR